MLVSAGVRSLVYSPCIFTLQTDPNRWSLLSLSGVLRVKKLALVCGTSHFTTFCGERLSNAPLFPGPEVAGVYADWCVRVGKVYLFLCVCVLIGDEKRRVQQKCFLKKKKKKKGKRTL